MGRRFLLIVGLFVSGFALPAGAGSLQRIGHTTLVPRHSNPDDKGMYAAAIDPTNGYAYFAGNFLFKLDITGNLPVQVGPSLNAGQPAQGAIDSAAGYLYLCKSTLNRYAVGAGTNAMTTAGSLGLAAGNVAEILIDDSDPNPTNHYGYVLCTASGTGTVVKVALSTFTSVSSVALAAGESNFLFGAVADPQKGYGYFVSGANGTTNAPYVVKIKFTPGTNAPGFIGAVNLNGVSGFVDGAAIDTLHGYAYYGTFGDTNLPGQVYKVKLENGDVTPTVVGYATLQPGEGRLAAGVADPLGGFVYFADDLTYPGRVYQLNLNGTNPPVEIGYLQMQGGTSPANPPNGMTAANATTNSDGVLPYGEVFFRSAVVDPIHGYAYLGQDSRPNQVVKIQLERDQAVIMSVTTLPDGSFQIVYTNTPSGTNTVWASPDMTVPVTNWTVLGSGVEVLPGQFQFTDPEATNFLQRFYRISSP